MLIPHKNILLGLTLIVLTVPTSSPAPQREDRTLFPISKDGKWGYIDKTGKIVIPPQFEGADDFHEGLARVTADRKAVFINPFGQIVIRPQFDIVHEFSEGLAAVNIGEKRYPTIGLIQEPGKWGYIDKAGNITIALKFTHAEDFSEGLAAVKYGERSGFIDHKGKMVFEAPLDVTWGFHEGVVLVKSHLKMIYFDRSGKRMRTPPLDDNYYGRSFSEGMAAVQIKEKWGYIDKTGNLVIKPTFIEAESFSEGLAPVQVSIDQTLEKPCVMPDTQGSSYTVAKRFGYIDKKGKMVIAPLFEYAEPFAEGLANVTNCYDSFFIDRTGKVAIPAKVSICLSFFRWPGPGAGTRLWRHAYRLH